jgi:hypothetical protein
MRTDLRGKKEEGKRPPSIEGKQDPQGKVRRSCTNLGSVL